MTTPAATERPLPVPLTMAQCGTCRWWRFKSDGDPSGLGWGICDSEANTAQVKAIGKDVVRRLLINDAGYMHDQADEMADLIGTRFREDFGCSHWQER